MRVASNDSHRKDKVNAEITARCPHCDKPVKILFRGYMQKTETVSDPKSPLAKMTPHQLEAIETARKTGILDKFVECVKVVKESNMPNSMERFYVVIMRTAVQKVVPREMLNIFRSAYAEGTANISLEFWASQGIGMVVANGTIQAFVPTEYVYGSEKSLLGGKKVRTSGCSETVRGWIMTKGRRLTVGQRLLFNRTRKQSMGGSVD